MGPKRWAYAWHGALGLSHALVAWAADGSTPTLWGGERVILTHPWGPWRHLCPLVGVLSVCQARYHSCSLLTGRGVSLALYSLVTATQKVSRPAWASSPGIVDGEPASPIIFPGGSAFRPHPCIWSLGCWNWSYGFRPGCPGALQVAVWMPLCDPRIFVCACVLGCV